MKLLKGSLCLFLTAAIFLSAASGCSLHPDSGRLIINEIMTQNVSFLTDASGNTPDWIELFNIGTTDVSLKGWYLSDNELDPDKYAFPDVTVKAGEYRVVFCDGQNYYDAEHDEIHAGFSLSSKGESLYLLSASGKLSHVDIGESLKNISFGRVEDGRKDDVYMWFAEPSPGRKNGGAYSENAEDVVQKIESKMAVVEYCAANSVTLPAPDGGYYGFITVKNTSDEDVVLSDYALSDNPTKPDKWRFKSGISLKPGESIRVWCSGLDTVDENGEMHASFKLNSNDKAISLALASIVVQEVVMSESVEGVYCTLNEIDGGQSFARLGDKSGAVYDSVEEAGLIRNMSVVISEVSATKGNSANESFDWIELYNPSDEDISLEGWSLSDKGSDRRKFVFPDKKIKSNDCLIVYCGDVTSKKSGSLYAGFKISTAGETLYLTNPDGVTVDTFETGKLRIGVTSGRDIDGTCERVFFTAPTPGKINPATFCTGYAAVPTLSNEGGYVTNGTVVTLENSQEGVTYRYTTDGSVPTEKSSEFKGITLNKNTVLRVRAFMSGKVPSDVATATYIIGSVSDRSIPIVCLASDPEGLFSTATGIFAKGTNYSSSFPYSGANFWKDWEREANFEYYVGGQKVIDALTGIKVFGQYSRAYDQKSISVYFRSDYGAESVSYPFFENSDHTTLKALVLRAGGQDQNQTRIRDAYASQVMKGHSSLVFQDWQPIAVYINGEYWGYFDLREKINASWLGMYAGVDGDNVDLIKGNRNAKAGSNEAYLDLISYVKSHDLSKSEYYSYVESKVDIDNYIDYLITEIFFANGDTGNIKFYCDKGEGGKWRWIMYDFDMTLRNESLWNSYNMFEKLFNPAGHGSGNAFSTALQCGLMKNQTFKKKFTERFAELLNTVFMPDNMKSVLDRMIEKIDGEMPRHCARWSKPETYDKWLEEVDNLYRIISKRRDFCKKQLIEYLKLTDSDVIRLFPEG